MKYGAVILAGGKSRRMGSNKAQLRLNGIRFLDKLVCEMSGFSELLISVDTRERYPELNYPMVCDIYRNCGPLGGLHAALQSCESDGLAAVPCDVPLFSKEIADQMCAYMEEGTDAVIAVTEDGRRHPLCGVYRKSCLSIMEQCLKEQSYRMGDVLARLRVKNCQVGKNSWRLQNVNTPEELQELKARSCLAISGWKNSGKTTLLEKLIPLLAKQGLNIATIKHDGHSYTPDVPGTDSHRFYQAGADTSIVYDGEKYSLTKRESVDDETLMRLVPEADLVLLEGAKWTGYPKIEVARRENGREPIPDLRGRIAYVSNMELLTDLPIFGLEDLPGIAAFIMEAYRNGKLKERWKDGENK